MTDATLLVVNGPGRGVRFDLSTDSGETIIGRSVGTRFRVDDTEVSRQHATVLHDGTSFRVRDLKSANGTFLNGDRITDSALKHGDSVRVGTTVLRFQTPESSQERDSSQPTRLVKLVDDSQSGQHSAIVQQVKSQEASAWPGKKTGLDLLYRVSEELVRPFDNLDSLLSRILRMTLQAVGADRACLLLRDPVGKDLTPLVFIKADDAENTEEQMAISRSITGHVLRHGNAVRTSDALHDMRFGAANSILSSGIREAICAPMRGHEDLLGVIYLDTNSSADLSEGEVVGRLNDEHLKVVLAVARQTALAIEARQFQDALLKAERFATMGQTVAVLSHHIKNILQGVGGGGYLIKKGIADQNGDMVNQGWSIVERNQTRIYDLVMDMLSFSKERVPVLQTGNVNSVCHEVLELIQSRAAENGVKVEFREGELPPAAFDKEGIHRAVLNIVANAIDAVAEHEAGHVVLQTEYDATNEIMLIAVTDNGPGIPEDQRASVFQVFESSKGARGTGIGLPVSRKIIREHGGRIRIEGSPGEGTRFVLSWPRGATTESESLTDNEFDAI